MKKALLGLLAAAVLFAVCGPYEVPRSLVVGWVFFLIRTLPRMTVDWPSVAVGCAALVLFTAGVHWAGRTWQRGGAGTAPRWKLRWSLATVAVAFLLFAAGISLIGIVHQAGWLLTSPEPYYVQTVEVRGRANTGNNLKQIALAAQNYDGTYGSLPPGGTFTPEGTMLHSWETHVLVFVGYSTGEIDFKLPWNHPRNEKYFKGVLPEFVNGNLSTPPLVDGNGFGLSHFAANHHVLAANTHLRIADIIDGTSHTLLVGEVNAGFKPWGDPTNWRDPAVGINRSPHGFGGPRHAGGATFSMADGSVRFVSERVSPEVLRALATPDGGETIDPSVLRPPR